MADVFRLLVDNNKKFSDRQLFIYFTMQMTIRQDHDDTFFKLKRHCTCYTTHAILPPKGLKSSLNLQCLSGAICALR